MSMPTITDPQMARVLERIEHIAKVLDRLEPLTVNLNTVQRDQEHMSVAIKQIVRDAHIDRALTTQIDRRTLVLERWHKAMVGLSAVAASAVIWAAGYVTNYFKTIDDDKNALNNRLTTVEHIVNSPGFEKAATSNRPVPEGKK